MRTVLSRREYRLLWLGQAVSHLGDQFHLIALPWLVLAVTGDPLQLGLVLAAAGVPRAAITARRTADMRYIGQGHEVPVPLPDGPLAPASSGALAAAFDTVYRSLYGRVAEGVPLEAVNWRVVVSGPRPSLNLRAPAGGSTDAATALKGERPIYLPQEGRHVAVPVYDRYKLAPGATFTGPAVVEERECTVIVGGGQTRIDEYRNLVVAMPRG